LEGNTSNKVRALLFSGLVAILVCLMGLLVVVFYHLAQIQKAHSDDRLQREKSELVEVIRDGVYSRSHIIPYTAIIEDYFDRYDQKDVFSGHAAKVADAIIKLEQLYLTKNEKHFFVEMRGLIAAMRPIVRDAMEMAVEEPSSAKLSVLMKETGWRQRELQLMLEEFSIYSNNLAQAQFEATEKELRQTEDRIIYLAGGLILSALLISVFLVWHEAISRRILVSAVNERTEQLRIEKDRAQLASRAKTEFLSSTSHELRTPLNAIIGFASTLRSGVFGPLGSEKQSEYILDIQNSGEHLLQLINDILDVSAIEAGQLNLHEEPVRLDEVALSCCQLVRDRAMRGKIKLINSVAPDFPNIHVDERRMKQIILNLMNNAVKFTPENGQIELKAEVDETDGITILVSDTGIGMDEEGVNKAMTPFGQVDGGLNRQHEGTGLGLPLTLGLIELHGGSMDIESAPNKGTTISVHLPKERVISG